MKLVKIHRNFLINKISLILVFFVFLISVFINFFCIKRLNSEYNWFDKASYILEYIETNILYYKLVVVNLLCFIWGSFFTKQNNSYHLLITGYRKIKLKFVLTKLLVLVVFTLILVFCNVFLMMLIVSLWGNFGISLEKVFELFVNLLLICLVYGLLSSLFSLLFNNNYACFVAVGLFVMGELIKDGSSNVSVYFVFFPTIESVDNVVINFGIIHLVLLFIIYSISVVFGYVYKK